MTMRFFLFLLVCFTASPPSRHQLTLAFKSNKIQPSLGGSSGSGSAYRRPQQGGRSSRSHISIHQDSPCVVRLAAGDEDSSAPTTIADGVERRFAAATTEKAEILVASGDSDDVSTAIPSKAATSTVNERLLSEIQASVEKEKYGSNNSRDYFKEFQSQKTEEERQRSIEEARDLNGVNPLVCIGGAAFAWACAGALWFFTTYLGVLFTSHPLETDVYFVQRLTQVFRNVVMGLSSLASGFFGVVGIGIFLLGIRVAYGVMTGELDPTPIKKSRSEEIVLPDIWGLMTGKKPNRRGKRGLGGSGGDDNPFGL
eukprot:CAMPEP_0172555326 /NCGR_PEP_ID=MMETSP1067-20121228/58357_1 /TAXON_ID=265564 ORGANISM="Thalassiosira punctigera, Strain Tpunct2005C2" /NCGR_SAMPLE_ID=MMETSP1067 /ASSEMBLY_ACC=CAM_ASM_000444 /LENGTH=311 /DNA_ID=CAMNT_0013343841 /DNA_START=33 /DNA_END=968 /DNA_ORIENTATION=+